MFEIWGCAAFELLIQIHSEWKNEGSPLSAGYWADSYLKDTTWTADLMRVVFSNIQQKAPMQWSQSEIQGTACSGSRAYFSVSIKCELLWWRESWARQSFQFTSSSIIRPSPYCHQFRVVTWKNGVRRPVSASESKEVWHLEAEQYQCSQCSFTSRRNWNTTTI